MVVVSPLKAPYLQAILDAARESGQSEREISRRATGQPSALSMIKTGRVPSTERARRLCDALGLEFYIGPPRRSTIRELKEKLLTPQEQATISPELEQAMEEAVAIRQDEIWREAAGNLDKALRKAQEAAEKIRGELSPSPNPVPVEVARALGLPDTCTVDEALAAVAEAMAALAEQHPGDEAPGAPDEYVPVSDVDGFEFVLFHIRRQALQPWATADRLMGILAANEILTTLVSAVPEGNWVVMDPSYSQPLQNGLFVTMDPALGWDGFAIEHVGKVRDKWLLFSGGPGRKPRPLGKNIRLFGRVAWHGRATSRDIRKLKGKGIFSIAAPRNGRGVRRLTGQRKPERQARPRHAVAAQKMTEKQLGGSNHGRDSCIAGSDRNRWDDDLIRQRPLAP